MPFKLNTAAKSQSSSYNGLHYDQLGRIGDIARRGFYPQQAATLKKDEIIRVNAEIDLVTKKMEAINDWMELAAKRAAKNDSKVR
jgi:hypothetical protein